MGPTWVILLASAASAASPAGSSIPRPSVTTSLGTAFGVLEPNGEVEAFRGLPYAIPPLGGLRFKPAVAISAFNASSPSTPFDAGQYCAECPQGDPGDREDCLCLNVWRPAGTTAASALPVYVFIHGGGFIIGSGKFGWTVGANLAADAKIVAVTLNYRLGPLGFMVTDEQSDVGNGGMNGLLDSIAALEFVQKHIGRFGGDPTRVTIGGQSSGSSAVCTLAVSPAAAGLFNRLVSESGPCIGPWEPLAADYGRSITQAILELHNATTIDGLRGLAAEDIVWPDAQGNDIHFNGYFLDDRVAVEQPVERYKSGKGWNVDAAIYGSNTMDGVSVFGYACPGCSPPSTAQGWAAAMALHWGNTSAAVMNQYPLSRFDGEAVTAFVRADADANVVCPAIIQARLAAAANVETYNYLFEYSSKRVRPCDIAANISDDVHNPVAPGNNCTELGHCGEVGWASHCTELAFFYNTTAGGSVWDDSIYQSCPFVPEEQALLAQCQGYLRNFIHGEAPAAGMSGIGGEWDPIAGFTRGDFKSILMSIDGSSSTALPTRMHDCAFWASQQGLPF